MMNESGADTDEQGYGGFYDERMAGVVAAPMPLAAIAAANLARSAQVVRMGAIGAFSYNPDLRDVGHGADYYPGSVQADAAALNYLGYFPDFDTFVDTTGSASGDQAASVGAWDPTFGSAVGDFQRTHGLTQDYWIGPETRRAIKAAIDAAEPPPPPDYYNGQLPSDQHEPNYNGDMPIPPNRGGAATPVAAGGMSTGKMVAIGGGAVALLALGYWLLK